MTPATPQPTDAPCPLCRVVVPASWCEDRRGWVVDHHPRHVGTRDQCRGTGRRVEPACRSL